MGRDLMYSKYCSYYEDHKVIILELMLLMTHISIICSIVYSTARELVAWGGDDFRAVILVEDTQQCASVPIISDTPTIVALASKITYGIKWNLLQWKVVILHLGF